MLIVEVPVGYEREREYVLDVVLGDMLGLPYTVRPGAHTDVRIRLSGDQRDVAVTIPDVLFATLPERWLTPASLPAEPLPWATGGLNGSSSRLLPVLYGTPEPGTGVTVGPSGIRLNIDVFGGAFFMLTCYEEMVRPEDDEHGRFPAASSLAARCGFLERPIVDEYVDLLWSALSAQWPGLRRKRAEYEVHLTHDVDDPFASRGIRPGAAVRASGGDVLRRRDLHLAWQRVRSLAAARRGDFELDPFNTYGFLMDVSEEHGLKSAFYFLAQPDDSPYPAPYEIDDPAIRAIIVGINDRGHELGLHGSYASLHDSTRLRREFAGLRAVTDQLGVEQDSWGGRQHYLRWRSPDSWRAWESAGLDYDASVGFAGLPGFRTGTCREHAVFDLAARRRLALRERPLHVMMDTTLFVHMGLKHDQAADRVVRVAARCRAHGGQLFLLCHNTWPVGSRARDWYRSVVSAVGSAACGFATWLGALPAGIGT